jgi:tryptophan synthase alpha chain
VGFGISRPDQAATVAKLADGVIIGSALIHAAANASDPATGAREFILSIRSGLSSSHL